MWLAQIAMNLRTCVLRNPDDVLGNDAARQILRTVTASLRTPKPSDGGFGKQLFWCHAFHRFIVVVAAQAAVSIHARAARQPANDRGPQVRAAPSI